MCKHHEICQVSSILSVHVCNALGDIDTLGVLGAFGVVSVQGILGVLVP